MMRYPDFLSRVLILVFSLISSICTAQLSYDTIIDRGIYKSYFNRKIKQPIAVVYKLYHGGGEASRNNDHFVNDSLVSTLKNKDYAKSGYDKGHLAPAEDFAYSDSLQAITFRYYNCVPQTPKLNRGKWKKYEAEARHLSQNDTVTIVCYNYFKTGSANRLTIPAICYKAVFDKTGNLLFKIGIENNLTCNTVKISKKISDVLTNFYQVDGLIKNPTGNQFK